MSCKRRYVQMKYTLSRSHQGLDFLTLGEYVSLESPSLPHGFIPENMLAPSIISSYAFHSPLKLQVGHLDLCKVHAADHFLHLAVCISEGSLKLLDSLLQQLGLGSLSHSHSWSRSSHL
jgi:hypothetical protein